LKSLLQKLFWAGRGKRHPLEKSLAYRFRRCALLRQALCHRSYAYAAESGRNDSNERLEFLGDAVLDLVVTDFLYRQYPGRQEGELSEMKSMVVSKKVLRQAADKLDLGRHLLLSHAEEKSGGRNRASIVADAYEAVLGAVFLDRGLGPATDFVKRTLLADLERFLADDDHVNFKSQLLESLQGLHLAAPNYMVVSEKGPDHNKTFEVSVMVGSEVWGTGRGKSKKEAEQEAAKYALAAKEDRLSQNKRR
jgi:ribonuclease-3